MNMPAFLRREAKEPTAPPLPRVRNEEMRQYALDFMNGHDRLLEETAWLRSENEQLRVDLKASREQVRALQVELNFVRDQHDKVTRHDSMMLGGLGAIKAAIVDLEERSRAEAFAPVGSGQQDAAQQGDELLAGVSAIVKHLAPGPEQPNA